MIGGRRIFKLDGIDDLKASVCNWLVTCPGSHPLWNQYYVVLIMLRDFEGIKPATITVAGATHELMIISLENKGNITKEEAEKIINEGKKSLPFLQPFNVVEQFEAEDDADALSKVEKALERIPSMDSDFRMIWHEFFKNTNSGRPDVPPNPPVQPVG